MFYLEVRVAEHVCRGVKVLDFLERRHDLGPGHASLLVHELDGGALAVVGHAVAHHHVKLVLVVLDAQDHGHRLADLDDVGDLGGVGALADLEKE